MITDFIKRLIGDTLEEYIEDFNASALEWTASDGNLRVKDVKLRRDAFDKLNMPFQLKSGWLGNLSIHVPQLVNLSKDPVKVTLEDVFMVTGPINDFDEEKVRRNDKAIRTDTFARYDSTEAIEMNEEFRNEQRGRFEDDKSLIERTIETVRDNIQINVKNLHIRFEDDFVKEGPRRSSRTSAAAAAASFARTTP